MAATLMRIAAASRPHPGEAENGDAWTLHRHGDAYRIALIDGLGHGAGAAAASAAARGWLDAHPEAAPLEALHGCHQALAGTRGAVMAVAAIDLAAQELRFAGVGNIEVSIVQPSGAQHLPSYRGIVGARLPSVRPFAAPLAPAWTILLHSDGVSAHFAFPPDRVALSAAELESLAGNILTRWGRATDDATVVIASSGACRPET